MALLLGTSTLFGLTTRRCTRAISNREGGADFHWIVQQKRLRTTSAEVQDNQVYRPTGMDVIGWFMMMSLGSACSRILSSLS